MIKDLWIKISYYWFVVMLIIVGFLCGGLKVNAAEMSYTSSSGWSGSYCTTGSSASNYCIDNVGSGKLAFGSYFNSSNAGRLYYGNTLLYPSTKLVTDNTYNVSFKIRFYNSADLNNVKKTVSKWTYLINGWENSTVGYSDSYISNFVCSSKFDTSTKDYFITTCNFKVNTPITRLQIRTIYWDISTSNANNYLGYSMEKTTVNIVSFTYSEGVGSQINNQTIVIENGFNDVNNTITDDSVDNPDSTIQDMQNMLPSNSTITSLIALPITLYQKVLNSVNGTCSSMNLGALYGTDLIMPCIEVSNYLGDTLWNTIDLIISGIFVLTIARKMIKAFNNFTFMKEGDVIND